MGPKMSRSASCISSVVVGLYCSRIAFAMARLAPFILLRHLCCTHPFLVLYCNVLHFAVKRKCVSWRTRYLHTLFYTLHENGREWAFQLSCACSFFPLRCLNELREKDRSLSSCSGGLSITPRAAYCDFMIYAMPFPTHQPSHLKRNCFAFYNPSPNQTLQPK